MTDDFFRARLEQMIDLKHPLAALSHRISWDQIETALAPYFIRQDREGKVIAGDDLLGATMQIAGGGPSNAGRRRRWLKRRQAVEPAIGHLKCDNRMDRCWLQGQLGDALHAVLSRPCKPPETLMNRRISLKL